MQGFVASLVLAVMLGSTMVGCRPAAGSAPAVVQAVVQAAVVRHYVGTTSTSSPDGAQAYGPPHAVAVRRTVDPAAGTIAEYVVHPGRVFPTLLIREGARDGRVVFRAGDEARSFAGTVSFAGPDWLWTAWDYDLVLSDGSGALRGSGRMEGRTIVTDKLFLGPDGLGRARIRELLAEVDAAAFARAEAALMAMTGE